ncbi:MAG: ATP-grasp domain-containing protein [Candidatus Poseidoniaceae archaeon]
MSIRLAVLSRGPRLYSTRRLVEEARLRDIDVAVLDPMQFSLFVAEQDIGILHEGQKFDYDAVIPRIGHSITKHGVSVLRHLEQLEVWTANSSTGILQSRDKLNSSQILGRNKIPTPKTAYVRDMKDVGRAIETVGGLPVVVKVTQGTQGQGVFLRHTIHETRNLVQGLLVSGKAVLIQEYIAESHGKDIRALVVGGRVVAAMRRKARGREFRSNYHLNGTVEPVQISEEYAAIACRAARLLGLNIAGVDLLEGNDGPLVLEVNSSPGLEGIEKASGVNVAGEIIDYVISESDFTEVNVDQLLKTIPGQGVVSVHMKNHPNMVGSKISDLFSGDIPVFAISRAGDLIWNPEKETQVRFHDILLCYGDMKQMRNSIKEKFVDIDMNASSDNDEIES